MTWMTATSIFFVGFSRVCLDVSWHGSSPHSLILIWTEQYRNMLPRWVLASEISFSLLLLDSRVARTSSTVLAFRSLSEQFFSTCSAKVNLVSSHIPRSQTVAIFSSGVPWILYVASIGFVFRVIVKALHLLGFSSGFHWHVTIVSGNQNRPEEI